MSYRFSCHRCGFRTRWRFLVTLVHDRLCRFPGHEEEVRLIATDRPAP